MNEVRSDAEVTEEPDGPAPQPTETAKPRFRRTVRRTQDLGYILVSLALVVLVWDLAVRLMDLPSYLLPAPIDVFGVTWEQRSVLWDHAQATTVASVLGFGLAIAVGSVLALLVAFSKPLSRLIYPMLVGSNALPKLALAPLFIVWLGFGMASKVVIAFSIAVFPIVIDTVTGLRAVPPDMIHLARSMGGGRWKTFWKIRVPYALPSFFSGLKVGISLAVVGAVVGEFVGSDSGLGYLVILTSSQLQSQLLYAALVVLVLVAVVLYALVELLAFLLTPGPKSAP